MKIDISIKAFYVTKSGTDFISILTKLQNSFKSIFDTKCSCSVWYHSNYLVFTNEM